MAYDEGVAERVREALSEEPRVAEKKMFGGLTFMVADKMAIGVDKDELMVRVGEEKNDEALARPHARPMNFTGREMKGFIFVAPSGFESDKQLDWWVKTALALAHAPAAPKKRAPRKKPR
jgi:TfoX/Sxy family transcriptional regulator of competence genes